MTYVTCAMTTLEVMGYKPLGINITFLILLCSCLSKFVFLINFDYLQ